MVGASASLQEDAHSLGVGQAAMRALAPAWLTAGKPPGALIAALISAIPDMAAHRRVALLAALLEALPQVWHNLVNCSFLSDSLDTALKQQNQHAALRNVCLLP